MPQVETMSVRFNNIQIREFHDNYLSNVSSVTTDRVTATLYLLA